MKKTLSITPFADILDATLLEIQSDATRPTDVLAGISSGFDDLDDLLRGGFRDRQLTVIGGRPSMGLLFLMMQMTEHLATNQVPVGLVSLTCSSSHIAKTMISRTSGVDHHRMRRTHWLRKNHLDAIQEAVQKLRKLPIVLDTETMCRVEPWQDSIRKMVLERGAKIVFVDEMTWLQNKTRDGGELEIARQLRFLAQELFIPIVCFTELSDGLETPLLNDLWCRAVSDVAMFLERKDNAARLLVERNANGCMGVVDLRFDTSTCTFSGYPNRIE